MGSFKNIYFFVCTLIVAVAASENDRAALEERFESLSSEILQLKSKNNEMEEKLNRLEAELEESAAVDAFDCYLDDYWQTTGIIQYAN